MRKVLFFIFIALVIFSIGLKLQEVADKPTVTLAKTVVKDSLPDIIDCVIGSVVHISNDSMEWQGSGVIIASDIILTARHVAENGTDFTITLNDGTVIHASRAISSKKYDVGFIMLDNIPKYPCGVPMLVPAKFGSIEDCRLGQSLFVIGSPYGKLNFNSVTLGIVSGLERDLNDEFGETHGWSIAFTTDSAGHPGNSGCPVFTLDGIVRGILVGGHSPVLIYCLPIDLFVEDGAIIRLMFAQDEYYFEEEIEYEDDEYYYMKIEVHD